MTKKMKIILTSIVCILLVCCGKNESEPPIEEAENNTNLYKMPEEMKDCKVYYIHNKWSGITVVKCPESSTTTDQGDKQHHFITVEN